MLEPGSSFFIAAVCESLPPGAANTRILRRSLDCPKTRMWAPGLSEPPARAAPGMGRFRADWHVKPSRYVKAYGVTRLGPREVNGTKDGEISMSSCLQVGMSRRYLGRRRLGFVLSDK